VPLPAAKITAFIARQETRTAASLEAKTCPDSL
jgi:hypothetical protein